MDSSDAIQFLILIILLALSAFFSSAETSMTTANRIRIQSLAELGDNNAKILLKITDNSGKLLSTILIGNNIVNIGASSLATSMAIRFFGNAAVGVCTGLLTLLVLLFGEITPKTLATIHAEKIALVYAKPIYALMTVLTPVIFIVNQLAQGILTILRVDSSKKGSTITEHELRTIVNVSHQEGVLENEEHEMINNVFDFGDSLARDIMIPRIDVTFIDEDSSYEDLIELFRAQKHVGATINVMMAAAMADGLTIMENVAKEPHVVDVANFLNSMGANIRGAGTDVIKIRGVKSLHKAEYSIIPDQIEAGTFMFAAAATRGDVTVLNVIPKHLDATISKLVDIGCEVEEFDDAVRVVAKGRLTSTQVKTLPYPGYPTDMQPQIGVVLALAKGTSTITESIFENRFKYLDELARMGANIKVEGNSATIEGVEKFTAARVSAPDLRAGAASRQCNTKGR